MTGKEQLIQRQAVHSNAQDVLQSLRTLGPNITPAEAALIFALSKFFRARHEENDQRHTFVEVFHPTDPICAICQRSFTESRHAR